MAATTASVQAQRRRSLIGREETFGRGAGRQGAQDCGVTGTGPWRRHGRGAPIPRATRGRGGPRRGSSRSRRASPRAPRQAGAHASRWSLQEVPLGLEAPCEVCRVAPGRGPGGLVGQGGHEGQLEPEMVVGLAVDARRLDAEPPVELAHLQGGLLEGELRLAAVHRFPRGGEHLAGADEEPVEVPLEGAEPGRVPARAVRAQQRQPRGGAVVAGREGPRLEQPVAGERGQPLGARRLVEAPAEEVVGEGLLFLPPPPLVGDRRAPRSTRTLARADPPRRSTTSASARPSPWFDAGAVVR